jgi:N-acetylneuraminic acid mutarotase
MFKKLHNFIKYAVNFHLQNKTKASWIIKMDQNEIKNLTNNYLWKNLENRNESIDLSLLQRSSHTLNIINEKIYVFGGEHDPRQPINNNVLTFDLKSSEWNVADDTNANGLKPLARLGHSSCVVNDSLYIFGGRTGVEMGENSLSDLWAYSAVQDCWVELKKSSENAVWPEARSFHAMASLKNKLFVFGGCSANHGRLNDLYEYDLGENKWTRLDSQDEIVARGEYFLGGFKISFVYHLCPLLFDKKLPCNFEISVYFLLKIFSIKKLRNKTFRFSFASILSMKLNKISKNQHQYQVFVA